MICVLVDVGCVTYFQLHATLSWYRRNVIKHQDESQHDWNADKEFMSKLKGTLPKKLKTWVERVRRHFGRDEKLQVVFCWDDCTVLNWRQKYQGEVQPDKPYKGNRKRKEYLHDLLTFVRSEIRKFDGVHVKSPGVEADDIIAVIAKENLKSGNKVAILTNDKDLHQIAGTSVFNLKTGVEVMTHDLALRNLWKKILFGDTSDNIPAVTRHREAKKLRETGQFQELREWIRKDGKREMKYVYAQKMIDLDEIPYSVHNLILSEYIRRLTATYTLECETATDAIAKLITDGYILDFPDRPDRTDFNVAIGISNNVFDIVFKYPNKETRLIAMTHVGSQSVVEGTMTKDVFKKIKRHQTRLQRGTPNGYNVHQVFVLDTAMPFLRIPGTLSVVSIYWNKPTCTVIPTFNAA